MKFYFFHLMPWVDLPEDYADTWDSAWVTIPNSLYKPEKGHELYNRYLDELEYADQLGFDGICVNEHHQTAYGLMPSPNLMAAALARRTSKSKIAILGNALSLRDHPLRVAEEVAMIDVISGGRVISGFVRGIGAESHSFNLNPAFSRERFLEAHDLIVKAWTVPGPFAWEGKHFKVRFVNPWPQPLQKPHPDIWIPSQGSAETIDWAAEKQYTYLQTYTSTKNLKRFLAEYRRLAVEAHGSVDPMKLGWAAPTFVGETDEQAQEIARPHIEALFNQYLRMPSPLFFPSGYLSEESFKRVLENKRTSLGIGIKRDLENLQREGYVIVGSPKTVTETIAETARELGAGTFVGMLQFARLPHDATMRNLELFAKEVAPALRDLAPHVEMHPVG
jgi:alkanesulfonate monooxygenase SsuD/methylene tetrahydromethanopterin reductase-like flavin-dependent oxidoreductase (luciferase family)